MRPETSEIESEAAGKHANESLDIVGRRYPVPLSDDGIEETSCPLAPLIPPMRERQVVHFDKPVLQLTFSWPRTFFEVATF
jgi:hypothetical protein